MKTNILLILVLIAIQSFTSDAQASWQPVSGLPPLQFFDLEVSGDSLIVASINKLYVSTDGGTTWDSTAAVSPTADYITDVLVYGSRMYVSTQNEGIYLSMNSGQTWQADNSGLNALGSKHIAMMTRRGAMIYLATYGAGVYAKSPFFPGGWQAFNQDLPWQNVESITNIDGVLYAGAGANATLSTRTELQTYWIEYAFDDFNGEINAFLGIHKEGDVLVAAGQQGLYRSDDNGAMWEGQPTGYGLVSAARFASNGQGRLWVHLSKFTLLNTLRYSDDTGQTWQNFEPGFTGSQGSDIVFFQNKLYYARSNGLWELDLSTGVEEPDGSGHAQLEIYPNPTAGDFKLRFHLKQKDLVEVYIMDAMGRNQSLAYSGDGLEGENVLPIQIHGAVPGVYQVVLRHSSGLETKSVVIGR